VPLAGQLTKGHGLHEKIGKKKKKKRERREFGREV